jgi:hypothetical protein
MLHTIGLIILGLCSIGVLSAQLEIWGMKGHPYAARIIGAVCVGCVAYTHTWVPFLIILGITLILLMLRTDVRKWRERKIKT